MEKLAIDIENTPRMALDPAHVAAIRAAGVRRDVPAGALVVDAGAPIAEFLYVESGEIEAVDPVTRERMLRFTIGGGQYLGEISFLNGGAWTTPFRAVSDTVLTAVPRQAMLDLMARIPEMSDTIVTVFAGRRRALLERGNGALTLVGTEGDRALQRLESFAARNRLPVTCLPLASPEAARLLDTLGLPRDRPVALIGRQPVADPTPREIARLLGLDLTLDAREVFDTVIVGGGPAGIAAAVYAGAEGLNALVIENEVIGGQAGSSSRIENFMGFPTGISGGDLAWRGQIQALRLGTRFTMPRTVEAIARKDALWCLSLDDGAEVLTRSVVIATGVQYRRLPIDRLEDFEGAAVHYAATDIEARFCRDHEVVVVGGGNSAGQAAMFLCRSARHVHVLIRRESLHETMSAYLSARLEADPAITIHPFTELTELHGAETLQAVTLRDMRSGATTQAPVKGVFIMVGAAPNTRWLDGVVTLNDKGFVPTGDAVGAASPYATSAPGIFAVGDVRLGSVKRVASGVGEGSVVISHVWQYVQDGPSAFA